MIKDKEKMLKELEGKFGCTDVDVYDDMVSVSYDFNNFEVQFGSELKVNTMSLLAEDLEEVGKIIGVIGKYLVKINFNDELKEIVEGYVEVTKRQSKATNIDELVKDESTIARLNRIYDTKDLLTELYDSYEEDTELKARIEKYGLDTIFAEVYDLDSYYIEYYNSGDDYWLSKIIDDLGEDFPVK